MSGGDIQLCLIPPLLELPASLVAVIPGKDKERLSVPFLCCSYFCSLGQSLETIPHVCGQVGLEDFFLFFQ